MPNSDSAVILFTLSPEAEGVRKPLGLGRPERAAAVFAALIEHLELTCRRLDGVDLLVSTPNPCPSNKARPTRLPQRGGDFGQSLRVAVEDAFALGYRRVVVIGNDAPEISVAYLAEAFHALPPEGSAAVIGPALDGGYNLLGLTAPCPEAFDAVPWGSAGVAELTECKLRGSGFRVTLLPTLGDIDNGSALHRFVVRVLAAGRHVLARVRKLALHLKRLSVPERRCPKPRVVSGTSFALAQPYLLRAPPLLC